MILGCRLLTISQWSPNSEVSLKPQLASSYSISGDQKSYTFTLNKDWYFHNGRRVVAEDVKYTLERVLDKKTVSPGANFLSGIVGEKDFNEGRSDHVVGIKVLAENQLRITLDRPRASLLFGLGTNFGSIVSREAVAKGDMDKFPVGCGAFKVESFEKNRLILAASSYYPKKELIYWSKINFTLHEDHKKASLLLLRGQIDFIHSFFTTTIDANPSNNPELAKYLYKVLEHETLPLCQGCCHP